MDGLSILKVYLENNTDKNVLFSLDYSSINGYMADPYWATSVLPYSSKYSTISWSQRTLEENLIFEVEDIEFELKAYDYDDWLSPNIVQEKIKIEFKKKLVDLLFDSYIFDCVKRSPKLGDYY